MERSFHLTESAVVKADKLHATRELQVLQSKEWQGFNETVSVRADLHNPLEESTQGCSN